MKNTAIFLAETWLKTQAVVHKAFDISAKQNSSVAIEYLMNNYPIIQGMGNQMRLKLIAEMHCDSTKIQSEVFELVSESNASDHRTPGKISNENQ